MIFWSFPTKKTTRSLSMTAGGAGICPSDGHNTKQLVTLSNVTFGYKTDFQGTYVMHYVKK